MNGATLLAVSGFILVLAYFIYGSYLEKVWGVDKDKITPAHTHYDGIDYVPATKSVLFGHQFSSIAGAGPINGPIIAAMFGWLPVFVWILFGGIFFGAVQDFAAMYASVRNEGKSISVLIERYTGKIGKISFLLFIWLFCILVISAFVDIVADTFTGITLTNGEVTSNLAGATTASTSCIFILFAVALGVFFKKYTLSSIMQTIIGIVLLVIILYLGISFPIFATKVSWLIFVFIYIFIASVLPVWLLLQPRDFLSSFLLLAMLAAAFIGIFVAQPSMELAPFNGFVVKGQYIFPILFVTIACGAISGFHSLVSSGTSSKQINNEKDMRLVSFGSMLFESFLGIIALICVGALAFNNTMPAGTPPVIFASALSSFLVKLGLNQENVYSLIMLAISAFALTSLDSIARIGRLAFQELFPKKTGVLGVFSSYIATFITLFLSVLLSIPGYQTVWPLFGSVNQLLAALALIVLSLFLKKTGKKNFMLIIPMYSMFAIALTSLVMLAYAKIINMINNSVNFIDSIQLIFAILLFTLGVSTAMKCRASK